MGSASVKMLWVVFDPWQFPVNDKQLFGSHRSTNNRSGCLVCRVFTTTHSQSERDQHYFRVGPVWRGTATRTRTGRALERQSSNVSLKMSAPMCKRSCRTVLRHYSTHEDFLMKDYFQFLRCSVWSARLGQRRTTNNFRTNFTRSNITLGRSLVLNYNLLCNLIWYILYRIKSNLTYTGQLAKDTSSQLKELNSYPPEQALDPRWSLMETLR